MEFHLSPTITVRIIISSIVDTCNHEETNSIMEHKTDPCLFRRFFSLKLFEYCVKIGRSERHYGLYFEEVSISLASLCFIAIVIAISYLSFSYQSD